MRIVNYLSNKRLLIAVSFLLIAAALAGCAERKKDKAGIIVWHWLTDREAAFEELAERYENQTGVKVKFELYAPSEAYSQKVIAAAQAGTLPDVFSILGERRIFASFIKAGHIACLSDWMNADDNSWRNELFANALAMSEFSADNEYEVTPGVYGVPIDTMNIQLLYNKDLFKKAGLDPASPPVTWQEFIEAGRVLTAAGIPGLVSGWGEIWMIDCFASNLAWNLMGKDKIVATIRGEVPYTDPDWITIFSLFKEMTDTGMLVKGMITMINKDAEQAFANNRAAFAFNGSWCVNVYKGMNPDLNYAAMLIPRVSKKRPAVIWGGAGSSFMVNQRSNNKEEAIKFLEWLTKKQQQVYLAEKTNNLPSNKDSLSAIAPSLRQFADDMNKTVHPSLLPVAEHPLVIEAFDKGIQSIIIGESSPEEIARKVQVVKERSDE